jgi:uncharacterized protein YdhG (YjbR/CyaY superfamily)
MDNDGMDPAVQAYIDEIPPEFRPLFDRVHALVLEGCPDATLTISYKMPTYTVGKHRLYLGVWKHGISIYGWGADRDAGFAARRPDLVSGKGTVQIRPEDAAEISDEELRDLARAALAD